MEEGDVQTCVVVLSVLGERFNPENLDRRRRADWYLSYIDMLHALRLWCVSNSVVCSSTEEVVTQMNQVRRDGRPGYP